MVVMWKIIFYLSSKINGFGLSDDLIVIEKKKYVMVAYKKFMSRELLPVAKFVDDI